MCKHAILSLLILISANLPPPAWAKTAQTSQNEQSAPLTKTIANESNSGESGAEKNRLVLESAGADAVISTVNQQKITRAQLEEVINQEMSAGQNSAAISKAMNNPQERQRIQAQALTKLINQALVTQAVANINATENPQWTLQAQLAVQRALNSEYINARIGTLPEPNDQIVQQIYRDNPDFYAKRKIYHYLLLAIPASSVGDMITQPEIEISLSIGTAGFDALKDILKTRKIEFSSTNNWLSADEIPPSVYEVLKELPESRTRIQVSSDKKVVLVLKSVGFYSDPLSYENARPIIIRQILSQKRQQMTLSILDELRAKANIDIYEDELSNEYQIDQGIASKGMVATRWDQFKFIWAFALPILGIGASVSFYRSYRAKYSPEKATTEKPKAEKSKTAKSKTHDFLSKQMNRLLKPTLPYSGRNFKKSFIQIARDDFITLWSSQLMQCFIMFFLGIWFCAPAYELIAKIPAWATLQQYITFSVTGLALAGLIIILSARTPSLAKIFANRWAAIAILTLFRLIVIVV